MQEKIRSYLSSLNNAMRSHDPEHMESCFKIDLGLTKLSIV